MTEGGDTAIRNDPRQAHRASLMLRRAKLVCQSGEYLCLIRDVSELGVGLGFMHDVPPEPRTLLQLANELTYPIERVWTGKRQAGFRFGAEVTLDEFLRENSQFESRPLRLQMSAPVRLGEGRDVYDARLLDLSCEGAKFTSSVELPEGKLVTFDLEGLPPQLGQVRWVEGKRHGLRFQQPVTTEELAACALHLQPFDQTRSRGFSQLLAKARAA
ncbi:PilZ domain-containing protein [uncultured Erythrobacter sp.]|uniref:PilZ domain-containing protein n=1 Tax=uncultured Erythrobacter sp. TaxID=263913 RepID=UPI002604D1F7|nr:PilZ domain-containing protein [uncultured Erythrobacter sp.]